MAAAPDLKRLTLELGGNDAAIVLPDADPAKIAEKLFWGAFTNCGQVCSAVKRIYVHESRYDDLSARLAGIAKGVKVGDGLDPSSQLGPINNQMQFERVNELVDDAVEHGAKLLSGGHRIGSAGLFYEPTILADVADGTRIVDEEQFGPAVPLIRYRDVEDAIERANATHFGLSGSVWGGDVQRATEIAGRLECGTSWVNTHLAILPNTPFGGAKWSGIGVENGPWGLLGFTELQTVHVAKT
jgi:acyl-CoA reductase-like NAD-dependent aldehyde dehydrogenase